MKNVKRISVFKAMLLVCLFATAAAASAPEPQYWPTCPDPQNIAPVQALGGIIINGRSSVVWNGQNFAVVWMDNSGRRLHFQKVFADGTLCGAEVIPSTLTTAWSYSPSLVWTGSGYGVAWVVESGTGFNQVYFARLHADGTLNGAEVKASFNGSTETAHSIAPSLAWNGTYYAVVWHDERNGGTNRDIFATTFDSSGAMVVHDVAMCTESNHQQYPSISWAEGSNMYVIVWQDLRSNTKYEIYSSWLTGTGAHPPSSSTVLLVSGLDDSTGPALADSGNWLGLTWKDTRDGNDEVYFARISPGGDTKIGSDVRLTNDSSSSNDPFAVWTGAEYGVFWDDFRSGTYETWFQRVSAGGTPQGVNTQVGAGTGLLWSQAAFAHYGYLATGTYGLSANYAIPWGCNDDASPPTCPHNFYAYSVSGTTAVVAWIPSVEDATDIAYYEVYRNSVLIARTSATLFADTELTPGATYNYYIRPVNAAQLVNGACTESIYLKTNATLTLKVDKSDPDARLKWTDASMSTYNVYRGTDPQVMQKIGEMGDSSLMTRTSCWTT